MSETNFDAALASVGFDAADIAKTPTELEAAAPVVSAPVKDESEALVKLTGSEAKKNEGTFVLTGQTLATDEGFRNVSKLWYDKTMSYADGLAKLEEGRSLTEDIRATVSEMVPTVNAEGKFAFLHRPTETYYIPTQHAMGQIGNWADTGTWYVENMLRNPQDYKGRDKYARDREDAETLAHVIRNGLRRVEAKKEFLWRVRKDGTLRAMLTDRFAIVDNRWFIEVLSKIIPGGRLSHWKGDSDTLYGNILIPDTIRAETDSEYGGMLSIGNSEIGERRVSSVPSIFRAICMNGCIWGQTKGKGIRQVHRGKIDLAYLEVDIRKNLDAQIPLLPVGIDNLLKLRNYGYDGDSVKPVFAMLAREFKMNKKQAGKVLDAYVEEKRIAPEFAGTGFAFTNAVTRAAQLLDTPAEWVAFDEIGGELTEWDKDDYDRLYTRAKGLTVKEVDEAFA